MSNQRPPDQPAALTVHAETSPARSPARALLIGAALTIGAAFWGFYIDNVAGGDRWTGASLMRGPLFALFCLVAANLALRALRPRLGFDQRELLIIYTMLVMGAAINGIGMLALLVPTIPAMEHYRQSLGFERFLPYAPRHLVIHDAQVIAAFFRGGESIWSAAVLRDWARPLLWWSSFILAFLLAILCLQVLVRKQWLQHERLVFPLAYVPLAITEHGGHGLRHKQLFWLGFAIVAVAQALSGLSLYFPAVPHVSLRQTELSQLQSAPPWSRMGGIHIAFNPFLVGIAYFVNLDVSLSIWFFYILFKAVEYLFAVRDWQVPALVGDRSQPLNMFMDEQGVGAFLGLSLAVLWTGRGHLREVMRGARAGWRREPQEMLSYRAAALGTVLGSAFMLWFMTQMGLGLYLALPVLLVMFAYAMILARLAAETGYAYYAPEYGGSETVLAVVGAKHVPIGQQVALGYLATVDKFYRDNPSVQQLNSMKLAEAAAVLPRQMLGAMVAGALVGLAAAWAAQLTMYYHFGADTGAITRGPNIGRSLKFMKAYYEQAESAGWLMMQGVSLGAALAATLAKLRAAFTWFPLHPAGYLICGTPAARFIWLPFLIGWLIKSVMVRAGGLELYRQGIPFFLGIIVGDTVVPAAFTAFAALTGRPAYQFFP